MKTKVNAGILTAIPETYEDMKRITSFVEGGVGEKVKKVYKKRRAVHACSMLGCRRVFKFALGLRKHIGIKHPIL